MGQTPSTSGFRRLRSRAGALAAAVAAALAVAACSPEPRRPDVVLVVIDSLRADRLHHAGDPRPLTPHLDALAAAGASYRQALAPAPWTTPSVMSIFTGLFPGSHHVDHNDRALASEVPTLPERFRQAGYITGAVMPALTLAEHFGFARGVDTWIFEAQGHARVSGPWSVEHARDFLRRRRGAPVFLYVHLWDVHYNYNPPVPHSVRFRAGRPAGPGETDDVTAHLFGEREPLPADRVAWLEGQYAGEILFTDEQVGRLLAELERRGTAADTIVVVTADHGEAFQEHGVLGHTVHLYDEMTRVPLIFRWPGHIPAGRRLEGPVSLVDLAPTLLELAGIPFDAGAFEGASRAAELLGAAPAPGADAGTPLPAASPAAAVLLSTSRRAAWRGLRSATEAYLVDLETGGRELYDLTGDAAQQRNLATEHPERADAWHRELCARLATPAPGGELPIVPLPAEVSAVLDSGLRSLGYVAGSVDLERLPQPGAERRRTLQAAGCPLSAAGQTGPGASPPRP